MFSVRCWMFDVNLGLRKTPNTEHRTPNRAPIGNWGLVIAWSLGLGIYPHATFPTTKVAQKTRHICPTSCLYKTVSVASPAVERRYARKFPLLLACRAVVVRRRERGEGRVRSRICHALVLVERACEEIIPHLNPLPFQRERQSE